MATTLTNKHRLLRPRVKMRSMRSSFPPNFKWGTATASYQIEGAFQADGKGISVWDTFAHTPGKIKDASTGDIACDHYQRYRDDVRLMRELGTNAYRFSVAWTRIQPNGKGKANAKGLEFYDRLCDTLLENRIEPWMTLYHWDLPQALEDAGGWASRDTALRFAEYAHMVTEHLHDRVSGIMTLNEPWVFTALGHATGQHAPGKSDLGAVFHVVHHALLAHGLGARAIREVTNKPLGIALSMSYCETDGDSSADQFAATAMDALVNRLFADPIFGRGYSKELEPFMGLLPESYADDLSTIAQPLDFLGINYYQRYVVREPRASTKLEGINATLRSAGVPIEVIPDAARGNPITGFGWEVHAPGMHDQILKVHRDYAPKSIMITENGAAYPDKLEPDGSINDVERQKYLELHLEQCAKLIDAGVPLDGYFCWSLMDNFEWAEGYTQRFGLYHVDFQTQKRTMKRSGQWYRDFIERRG
jgi:beta-glucosidase